MQAPKRARSPSRPRPIVVRQPTIKKPTEPPTINGTTISVFDPKEFIRLNGTRNSYDICVIKKLIGKKILIPAKGMLATSKVKSDAKAAKTQLLSKDGCKNLVMHVVCINGTMHIINGYHNYLALSSITYKDIDMHEQLKRTEIKIVQLPKVSNVELQQLIDYF